jgi:hypothetical protein
MVGMMELVGAASRVAQMAGLMVAERVSSLVDVMVDY